MNKSISVLWSECREQHIAIGRLVTVAILMVALLFVQTVHAQQPSVQLRELTAGGSLEFGPTSNLMLSKVDGYYQMWNWRDQKLVGPRMLVNSRFANDSDLLTVKGQVRFSHDGRFMAACRDFTDREITKRSPMLAQVWDMRSGVTLSELERAIRKSDCKALDFSPDGNTLAVADGSYGDINVVRFFDTRSWTEIRRMELSPSGRLLEGLRYSPDGRQLVVWSENWGTPASMSYKEYDRNLKRIGLDGSHFMDHRVEAIVLSASENHVLARRVLHWFPKAGGSLDTWGGNGFDASGERILSSVPFGGVLETTAESTFKNCTNYQPPSIPEGFESTDLCQRHKAVQVWHWRTGQVDTIFEYPNYLRTPYHDSASPTIWTTVSNAEFTADGRYLVWVKHVQEQDDLLSTELSQIPPSITTLEIRDASSLDLLLSHEMAPKGKSASAFQVAPDGRYLTWTTRTNRRFNMNFEKHLFELAFP